MYKADFTFYGLLWTLAKLVAKMSDTATLLSQLPFFRCQAAHPEVLLVLINYRNSLTVLLMMPLKRGSYKP